MESGDALYDQASTVFSPDGRLYQVEYAREAVNKGSTTLGMKFKDGVVLIAHKDSTSNLIKAHTIDKIFQIDDHIGCAFSGLVADAQRLVEIARDEAQVNRLAYDEQIPVKALVEIIRNNVSRVLNILLVGFTYRRREIALFFPIKH